MFDKMVYYYSGQLVKKYLLEKIVKQPNEE